jgi:NADH-quinone oxidoreductase subunit C
MPLEPAITDIEMLKDRPAVAKLLAWRKEALQAAKWDRNELTLWIDRHSLRDVCEALRDDPSTSFNFLSDITCVDWFPSEPRFEVVYALLSHEFKQHIRLKVKLNSDETVVDSLTELWPGANMFEREVFDLFGVRFQGHPYLRRLLMPDDWKGHPLRKDYPVEGYR